MRVYRTRVQMLLFHYERRWRGNDLIDVKSNHPIKRIYIYMLIILYYRIERTCVPRV